MSRNEQKRRPQSQQKNQSSEQRPAADANQEQYVFGIHAVTAIIDRHPRRVTQLYLADSRSSQRVSDLLELAQRHQIQVTQCQKQALDEKVEGNHQGVVASCLPLTARGEQELEGFIEAIEGVPLLLILDGITDPHNLGACLRSAEAAGVHAVIVPKDKSADLSPVARKVACGAAELIPFFRVTNLARCIRQLQQQGIWMVGLAGEASSSIYDIDFSVPSALVMGAEGAGLRKLSRDTCDYLAKIPMPGSIESLNVSVATGVCLFEACRQRAAD